MRGWADVSADQLKTFNAVDVSVGICRNPPFGSRKPPRRLGARSQSFKVNGGDPASGHSLGTCYDQAVRVWKNNSFGR